MKRVVIVVPVIVATLLALLLVVPGFVDWSQYKQPAIDKIKEATGYDVQVDGRLSMAILPTPHVTIENVKVAAPAGSAEPTLATIERLDMNLALAPLFTGRIDFSSVELVKPFIALQVFSDGRQNWMTPQLEAMAKGAEGQPKAASPAIALQNVAVSDGRFKYLDAKAGGKPFEVSGVNVDLGAETLARGPFRAKGALNHGDQAVKFEVKTGGWDKQGNSIPVNLQAALDKAGAEVIFAGVVGTQAPFSAQGETTIKLAGVPQIGAAEARGLLTANQEKAELKNALLHLADGKFSGDVTVNLKPLSVKGSFAGEDTINLDKLIKIPAQKPAQKSSEGDFAAMLPQTITIPAAFEADVALTAPAVVFNGKVFRNAAIKFTKGEKNFKGGFAATQIPGGGDMNLLADLNFAAKTVSAENGAETYSEPKLVVALKGQTQNLAETALAVPGLDKINLPAGWKTASFNGMAEVAPGALVLKDSQVEFNGTALRLSGSYETPVGKRPVVTVDAAAGSIDLDALMKANGGGDAKKGGGDPAEALKSLALPYDVRFDVGAESAKWQGHDVKGLRAQGALAENALAIENLSAQNFAGASFKMNGKIGNLKDLSGLAINLNGQSSDLRAFTKALGMENLNLPESVNAGSLSLTASGAESKMDVNATASALGGSLTAKGVVSNPLKSMTVSGLAAQVKHPNTAEAMRMLAPTAPRYASWAKPMDISADVDQGEKILSLKNIRGAFAGASVAGAVTVDSTSGKPSVDGKLEIGDLAMVGGSSAGSSAGRSAGAGHWSQEPLNTQWMNSFNADIDIKAKSVLYGSWDLRNAVLAFNLRDGRLDIEQIGSDLFGGKVALNGAVTAPPSGLGPVGLDLSATMQNVAYEKAVGAFVGQPILRGQGTIDSMETSFKGSGTSAHALVSSLNGNGRMTGRNIVLEGFDLTRFAKALSTETKPGDTALGLWKSATKGGSTAFDTLDGAYTITSGIVQIGKMDLDGQTASLKTTGQVDLPRWTIATAHTIALKDNPDAPPFTVNISGPLDNPANTMAQGLMQDYLSRKISRKLESILSDKLGLPSQVQEPAAGEEGVPAPSPEGLQSPPPAQQQIQPEEAIRGLLNNLLQ